MPPSFLRFVGYFSSLLLSLGAPQVSATNVLLYTMYCTYRIHTHVRHALGTAVVVLLSKVQYGSIATSASESVVECSRQTRVLCSVEDAKEEEERQHRSMAMQRILQNERTIPLRYCGHSK